MDVLPNPTTCVPKARLAGVAVAGKIPVPDSAVVCGLLFASSVTVTVPVSDPVVVGAKTTLIVQLETAAKEVPQLFVWE